MVIDFHTHIGKSKDGSVQTFAQLYDNMKKYGVLKCVVFPLDVDTSTEQRCSMQILEESKRDSRIIPFLRFDPKKMDVHKLHTFLDQGYKGVKLHPRANNFDPLNEDYFELYQIICDRNLPLLIHTKKEERTRTDPLRIVRLAVLFPTLTIILAHFASSQPEVFEFVKKHNLKNVYFDTSVSCVKFSIEYYGKMIGFDNILFGSDCPYSDQEVELLKIQKLSLSDDIKEKILYKNAQRILNI